MKNVIISAYYWEKRFETKNPTHAHLFDVQASVSPKWIKIK